MLNSYFMEIGLIYCFVVVDVSFLSFVRAFLSRIPSLKGNKCVFPMSTLHHKMLAQPLMRVPSIPDEFQMLFNRIYILFSKSEESFISQNGCHGRERRYEVKKKRGCVAPENNYISNVC